MSSDKNLNGFGMCLGAFVLGAAAGVTIALLTAPRSGRETRARLKDAALELQKKVERGAGAIQQAGSRALKAGQAAFDQAREEAS